MAEIALTVLDDSSIPPQSLRGTERAAIVIHLDAAALPAVDELTASCDQAEVRSRECAFTAPGFAVRASRNPVASCGWVNLAKS
ncbi:MAG: hypothetical protein JWO57_1526 [Pseudonocardiales bacterium]|nr:hypothetical protein [Pseudonocardiales bacterium]